MDEESFRGCASAKSHFITIIINSLIIFSDEWLALEISALETFYSGQFAFSTQLKKTKFSCNTWPTRHHGLFRNIPFFIQSSVCLDAFVHRHIALCSCHISMNVANFFSRLGGKRRLTSLTNFRIITSPE